MPGGVLVQPDRLKGQELAQIVGNLSDAYLWRVIHLVEEAMAQAAHHPFPVGLNQRTWGVAEYVEYFDIGEQKHPQGGAVPPNTFYGFGPTWSYSAYGAVCPRLPLLRLGRRPVSAVAVAEDTDGDQTWATTTDATTYALRERNGVVESLSGTFAYGVRRWRATYTAGFGEARSEVVATGDGLQDSFAWTAARGPVQPGASVITWTSGGVAKSMASAPDQIDQTSGVGGWKVSGDGDPATSTENWQTGAVAFEAGADIPDAGTDVVYSYVQVTDVDLGLQRGAIAMVVQHLRANSPAGVQLAEFTGPTAVSMSWPSATTRSLAGWTNQRDAVVG